VSLSWRDDLGVALYPDRLVLTRTQRRPGKRLKHREAVPLPATDAAAPRWQGAVDALANVPTKAFADAEITVVLSSFFVRYTLLPWSDVLAGPEEHLAFAGHCFAEIYGADIDTWVIRISRSGKGAPQVACAAERSLIDAIDRAMAPVGSRFHSVQPHLMASFNPWRRRFDQRPAWFVTVEPGLACLALLQGGEWQSVRATKISADWTRELPGLLSREACLVESAADCNDVLVFAPDGPHEPITAPDPWRIEHLTAKGT
jgi:hypothetical protein